MGKKVNFSKAELERYSRHIILPEFEIKKKDQQDATFDDKILIQF